MQGDSDAVDHGHSGGLEMHRNSDDSIHVDISGAAVGAEGAKDVGGICASRRGVRKSPSGRESFEGAPRK